MNPWLRTFSYGMPLNLSTFTFAKDTLDFPFQTFDDIARFWNASSGMNFLVSMYNHFRQKRTL